MTSRVDLRATGAVLGRVLRYLAVPLAVPVAVALYYGESTVPFLAAAAVTLTAGTLLSRLDETPELETADGFLFVGLTWLVVPLVGTVPYLVAGNGTVAAFPNALFESMSGFTTTGATVLGDISFETHSRAMLMWRQLTQWLGGMGIVVLVVAILPELGAGGATLVESESPGLELDKLTPRIAETARALWLLYVALTVVLAALLYVLGTTELAPGMGAYDAVAHALTTMPTGGFSPEGRSIEAFSPAVQWVITLFMLVAGTNFALLWRAQTGDPDRLLRNTEFRVYVGAVLGVGAVAAALLYAGSGLATEPENVPRIVGNLEPALRHGLFQAAAIVTTTGYASMDFNTWSAPAQYLLLLAMFFGGSGGSAAGSVKIVRWVVVVKAAARELVTTGRPDTVRPVRLGDEVVEEETIRGVQVFTLLFLLGFGVSTFLLFVDALGTGVSLSVLEAASATVAILGNVGPGFGLVGPMNGYTSFSGVAKLFMVFLMWIGRLEIITVLVLLTPSFWRT
ncbi:TrkH family potassium uptake protein [Halobaculum sp. MBLA0147]|uniref:TrkH family potassium uptake protein n=1 Tax=Halobaculum sp. MBLA0147 TaxID=3079934 RepID=UPI003523F951